MAVTALSKSRRTDVSLAVLIHAFTLGPESMARVAAAVVQLKKNVHVIAPKLPLGMFSTTDADALAVDVLHAIDTQLQFRADNQWPAFEEIVLIGHSIGALIARKVYVLAQGEISEVPFESGKYLPQTTPRPWAGKVTRIILFAGMNRGWSITHHLGFLRAAQLTVGSILGHTLLSLLNARLVIFQARRGSMFLTQLRLQWLAMAAALNERNGEVAMTIQLLGSIDDLVSPEDNIDLITGRNFLYLDVPYSGHTNVIELDDTEAGRRRGEAFQLALTGTEQAIRTRHILPEDPNLASTRGDVTNVIFVIHGIRDAGYWTHKIARKIMAMGHLPPRIYASETAKYGYFPMAPFLLPSRRRQKVEWLMDQYVEAKALYPRAIFSYVGHSHGTYLLAYALENYPTCRFDHVVFAGSVVRRKYDWAQVMARNQVRAVFNYVATADWVVAWLPGALELLRLQDLGTAGHNGFSQARFVGRKSVGPVFERRYIRGGHGAALDETNWDDIAHFAVNGRPRETPAEERPERRNRIVAGFGMVAPLVWVIGASFLVVVGWGLSLLFTSETVKTLVIVAYALGIWRIVTWL